MPATAVFEVTNISKEPPDHRTGQPNLRMHHIGDYTKEPIAPGKSGVIKATYNAKT